MVRGLQEHYHTKCANHIVYVPKKVRWKFSAEIAVLQNLF
jgi:hypothetical protein